MKKGFKLLLAALIFAPLMLLAQVVVPDTTGIATVEFTDLTADQALNYTNVIFMALTIIWGYLARAFKIKVKPGKFVFVVVAGGIVIGGAFVFMGWAKVVPLALSLLASLGVFDAILRPSQNAIKNALAEPAE